MQTLLSPKSGYRELDRYLEPFQRIFLVCGRSFRHLAVGTHMEELERRGKIRMTRYSGFSPNPDLEDIQKGTVFFQAGTFDLIVSAGGGSAIDTAKCIRHYSGSGVPLLAVPTTAGSGSEATHFAVAYRQGVKESVDCGLPDAVLLDPSALGTLPDYQRKATMLDALCHGIESFWSVNATPESRVYSHKAIVQIMDNYEGYLKNTPEGNAGMLEAAHLAGKAINIAKTTAGHAMCYQITKRYGLAHGHAAALCVAKLWPWLLDHRADIRLELAAAMGCGSLRDGAERFQAILDQLELETPACTETELTELTASVNLKRMKNLPMDLDPEDIRMLYRQILRERE